MKWPERLHREQTRRVEHRVVGSKQENVVATQNLWNEAEQLLKHAGSPLDGCQPDVVIQ
jgi:hypothetical protein